MITTAEYLANGCLATDPFSLSKTIVTPRPARRNGPRLGKYMYRSAMDWFPT
jgi:hypothetical protein